MMRTHYCGHLNRDHIGQTVTLCGWAHRRRDHGGVAFIDLRDASGVVQVVIRDEAIAHQLRSEYCVQITGEVTARPEGNENADLATGEIEILADVVNVLSEAAPLPFPIDDHIEVGDEARLRHRYLDLRRSGPGAAIRLRSKINQVSRNVLLDRNFVEIETPKIYLSSNFNIGLFHAITNSVFGYLLWIALKIAFTVFFLTRSSFFRKSSIVAKRLEDLEPRLYITSALACAWLNPCSSFRKAICSGYFH